MKSKGILLNGATRSSNFGDFLFAYIFQKEVSSIVGQDNTFWYESPFALSDFFKENLGYNNHYSLKKIKALVCISGGYFCGNDRRIKDYLLRYFSYWHICLKCIFKKVPIAIIGLDVGKTQSFLMEKIEKYILRHAEVLTVRNQESIQQLKDYGIFSGMLTSDTAHAIENYLDSSKSVSFSLPNQKKILFLHVSSVKQTEIYLPSINHFLRNHEEYSVLIGTDQYHSNYDYLYEIKNKLECEYSEIYEYDDPIDLCYVLKSVDVIVTSKLHVGIVGSTFGKSVVSFPNHAEKIKRYYEQIGEIERSLPLAEYDEVKCYHILEQYHNVPIYLNDSYRKNAEVNINCLRDFILKNQL